MPWVMRVSTWRIRRWCIGMPLRGFWDIERELWLSVLNFLETLMLGWVFSVTQITLVTWKRDVLIRVSCWCWDQHRLVGVHRSKRQLLFHRLSLSTLLHLRVSKSLFGYNGFSMRYFLFCDNQSSIRLIKNPEFHKRTKHIDVKYHFIREKFSNGFFDLQYVSTDDQVADILTKPLAKDKFTRFRSLMGIVQLDQQKSFGVHANWGGVSMWRVDWVETSQRSLFFCVFGLFNSKILN